ncbi:hypothetical protein MKW92_036450, partial [Papaver armeniacum]
MDSLQTFSSSSLPIYSLKHKTHTKNTRYNLNYSPLRCHSLKNSIEDPKPNYELGALDVLLLNLFRNKMVKVGWDSTKPGYEGLIE